MKIYYVRHQAAGVVHEHPFTSPPSQDDLDAVLATCESRHGKKHPKTGASYWAKVIVLDTELKADDPNRVKTHSCAHGGSAESVDKRAAGKCPIRDGEHVPEKSLPAEAGGLVIEVSGHGTGFVKNP